MASFAVLADDDADWRPTDFSSSLFGCEVGIRFPAVKQNHKTVNGLWLKVPQVTVTESCSFQIGEQRFRLNAGG